MNQLKRYDTLSEKNVRVFEESLIQWGQQNNERGIMLFDESSLRKILVGQERTQGMEGIIITEFPSATKKLRTKTLELEWNGEGEKSILLTVKSTVTGKTIYKSPKAFAGSELWFGC